MGLSIFFVTPVLNVPLNFTGASYILREQMPRVCYKVELYSFRFINIPET